jgi:GTP cyclohydrolase I
MERANHQESTGDEERASSKESTTDEERAVLNESTATLERTVPKESTAVHESVEDYLAEAFQTMISSAEGLLRKGTLETPERAARAWLEMTSGYQIDIASLFKTFDSDGYDEMVAVTDLPLASLCEHHLLAFVGTASVVYIPDGKIVGLSKIGRVVDAFAARLQVQERLTAQIADAIEKHLEPSAVLVVIEAQHSCMALRGVRKPGWMKTSAIRGVFRDRPEARAEAYALIDKCK